MSTYRIKGETLENMADKIRILNGVEGELTTAQMDSNLGEANADVSTEADLIAQISSALEGKVAGGGSSSEMETCTLTISNVTQVDELQYISLNKKNIISPTVCKANIPTNIDNIVKNSIVRLTPKTGYMLKREGSYETGADDNQSGVMICGDMFVQLIPICYIENTEILLKNGSRKKVQDITYTDELIVWDFDNGCYASACPLWIKKEEKALSYYHCVFENGITLDLVGSNGNCHAVFCSDDNCFEYANNCVGKMVMTKNGATKLLSCELKYETVKFYNIITYYHMNCYANDVLTSTKLNNIYQIENMKFVMEDRQLIPIEKFGDITNEFYYGLRLGENKVENLEYIKDNITVKLSKMLPKEVTKNVN